MVASTDKTEVRIKARVIKIVKRHLRSVRVETLTGVEDVFFYVRAQSNLTLNYRRLNELCGPMATKSFIRKQTTYDRV